MKDRKNIFYSVLFLKLYVFLYFCYQFVNTDYTSQFCQFVYKLITTWLTIEIT